MHLLKASEQSSSWSFPAFGSYCCVAASLKPRFHSSHGPLSIYPFVSFDKNHHHWMRGSPLTQMFSPLIRIRLHLPRFQFLSIATLQRIGMHCGRSLYYSILLLHIVWINRVKTALTKTCK